jgi:hypothetical protein
LPHLNAVIAGRGIGRLVALLAAEAAIAGLGFDDLAAWLPSAAERLAMDFADDLAKVPARDRRSEIFLVGRSERAGSFVAHSLELLHDGSRPSHVVYVPTATEGKIVAAPWPEIMGPLPTLDDLAGDGFIIRAVERQCALMNTRWSPGSAGGCAIVTLLTPDRMVSRRYPLGVAGDHEQRTAAA